MENHPFLTDGEKLKGSRMIIGTFPIYSLTLPRSSRKDKLKKDRKDFSWFYGSRSNYFWAWYKTYIDQEVDIINPEAISRSLQNHQIAMSDVILNCTRVGESYRDSDLKNIIWNHNLAKEIEKRIDKVICTSKSTNGAMGWLISKILIPAGFELAVEPSFQLHNDILNGICSSNSQVKPIAFVLIKKKKTVRIVALPSPGSPFRRLNDFGRNIENHTSKFYLDLYLAQVFNWFVQK